MVKATSLAHAIYCRVLTDRTTKVRNSFVKNTVALAEEAAALEAAALPQQGEAEQENPMLQILRR